MAVALNSYASKVFSEHPIGLWPMDDDAYFVSLIDDNDRLFSNWTLSNASANNSPVLPDYSSPFLGDSSVYSALIGKTSASGYLIQATSPVIFNASDLNENLSTFTINFFLHQVPINVSWFKFGYSYVSASVTNTILSSQISPPSQTSWVNFNKSYQIPTNATNIKLILQIQMASGPVDINPRTFIMHGLSVGQWSDSTNYKSLGIVPQSIPSSVGFFGLEGYQADQYGLSSDNGYYIIENNSLLAKNDGPPLVFGTDNSTKIYPSDLGRPSFIFPGKGMLNEVGRYNSYTFEMWLTINPATYSAKRIIGPINSIDGIYVKEGFLTLAVGSEIGSHFVGEWYRPMLLHLIIREKNISMLINGEEVISIPYDRENISLSTDADWWGIYSNSSIDVFATDCISIYPYVVSQQVAKRRFVWGQGTTSVQFIDDTFFGTPTTIDFSTAQYNANILYPDVGRWDAGYFSNLVASRNFLSVPNYSLPFINIGDRSLSDWYSDNNIVNNLEYQAGTHPKFVSFRPNISYDINNDPVSWIPDTGNDWTDASYFNFPSLNLLTEPVSAVYGIFEADKNILESRPLIHFINTQDGSKFEINISNQDISYSINGTNLSVQTLSASGSHFVAGINIQDIGATFGYEVQKFFNAPSSIQVYIGGDGTKTFEGKIYRIGFCNSSNLQTLSNHFNANGTTILDSNALFIEHFASYTLTPFYEYNRFFLDISISAEWEEYFPMSFFGGYVNDENGNNVYDIDFIQVNIGYPFLEIKDIWTYQNLSAYSASVGFTYGDLANPLISSYLTYGDLRNNNSTGDIIDFSQSSLNMYMTIQPLSNESATPIEDFLNPVETLGVSRVIYPQLINTIAEPEKMYQTKFEIKDNTIIYPPKTNFENYMLVFTFKLDQKAILTNPVKIRDFEITSKVFSGNSLTPVGTKFGTNIYPYSYVSASSSYLYKEPNPFFIYKRNTPYLYHTNKSGIKIVDEYSSTIQKGIKIPINSSKAQDFDIAAMQLWCMYDYENISASATPIFEISDRFSTIQFIIQADESGQRGIISAIDKNNPSRSMSWINFYQNGTFVTNPVIQKKEWNAIGIAFAEALDFNSSSGEINLFGGIVYNDISYYQSVGMAQQTGVLYRSWDQVYETGASANSWSYWNSTKDTWEDVYILTSNIEYSKTPADIYAAYSGTNRFVIDDNLGISITENDFVSFSNVLWSSFIQKPV